MSIKMKFFRRTGRYTHFGHKRNEEILEELKVDEKLRRYKLNCLWYVTEILKRIPKIMLNYRQNGRRCLRRLLNRLLDEAETGLSGPNWWRIMMMMMMVVVVVVVMMMMMMMMMCTVYFLSRFLALYMYSFVQTLLPLCFVKGTLCMLGISHYPW